MREDLLTTFPVACHLRLEDRAGLKEWLVGKMGVFTVNSATNSGYDLTADSFGLSKHLLSDIELLTNECFEHLQEGFDFYSGTSIRSEAWNIVTVYYFAFYSAQILLRLIGSPIVFLKKNEASDFSNLAGVTKSRGAGSYQLKRKSAPSNGYVECSLKKSPSGRAHDAVWNALFTYLESIKGKVRSADQSEQRIFDFLTSKVLHSEYGNYCWPSEIRNRANYWPGYIYRQVELKPVVSAKRLIANWRSNTLPELLSSITTAEASCQPGAIGSHISFFYQFAQVLFMLSRQLYSELLNRKLIDPRREQKRAKYKATMCQPSANDFLISSTY